jgi:hypothetical protein
MIVASLIPHRQRLSSIRVQCVIGFNCGQSTIRDMFQLKIGLFGFRGKNCFLETVFIGFSVDAVVDD